MKIRENYLLNKRQDLMLDFFLKTKKKTAVFVGILDLGLLIASIFVKPKQYQIVHFVLGTLTILVLIVFVMILLGAFNNRLSEEEAIKLIDDDNKNALENVFTALGVENDKEKYIERPIEVTSPAFYPGSKTLIFYYSKKYSRLLYSQGEKTYILFGKDSLYYYHANINHITGSVGYQTALEVRYKDIITVSTEVKTTGQVNRLDRVAIVIGLVNGEALDFNIRMVKANGATPKNLTENEIQIIYLIRNIIRKNK